MPIYKDDWMNAFSNTIKSYADITTAHASQLNYNRMTENSEQKQKFDQQMQLADFAAKQNEQRINANIGLTQALQSVNDARIKKETAEKMYLEEENKLMQKKKIPITEESRKRFRMNPIYAGIREAALAKVAASLEEAGKQFSQFEGLANEMSEFIKSFYSDKPAEIITPSPFILRSDR